MIVRRDLFDKRSVLMHLAYYFCPTYSTAECGEELVVISKMVVSFSSIFVVPSSFKS